MKTKIISIAILVFSISASTAQDTIQNQIQDLQKEIKSLNSEEKSHFMVRGFVQFGIDAAADYLNFNMSSFNPVLLWRQGDRFLFESELEMEYMDNQFSINLGYANATYSFSKALNIKVGKFLLPFGTFGEKFHPSWINKFSSAPLGVGHDGMLPMADIGFQIRGGFQLGTSKLSYAVYAVNGPGIKDGTEEPDEAGMLSFENSADNNNNKAVGARLGILPLSNSSLEIGFSEYYAKPGSAHSPFEEDTLNEDLNYRNVTAMLAAFDLSFVKLIKPIKGIIDLKGQYNFSTISNAWYFNPEDTSRYTFENKNTSYYVQLAYRPAMVSNKFIKKSEIAGRYTVYNTPKESLWNSNQLQKEIGLNYWFTWRTVLKISYQISDGTMGGSGMNHTGHINGVQANMFLIHLATGL